MASSWAAADEEGTAGFVSCWLDPLSCAVVDFARLAFLLVALFLGLFGVLPMMANFSLVPAETSWSILRVWRAWAKLEIVLAFLLV